MAVLHVVSPGAIGGLERVVQTLAAAQCASKEDVHVVAVVSHDSADVADSFLEPLRAAGVSVHSVELRPREYLRERAAIAELCRRYRPSIVHTHGYRADLVDIGVARTVNAAAVTTVHGYTGGSVRNRCYEWLQRRALRRFDAVVAVSRPLAQQLVQSGVPAKRVHFVPNAWRRVTPALPRAAARNVLGIPHDAFIIGWVGRVSEEKGLDVLLAALTTARTMPMRLSIVGDGPQRPGLELLARRSGLAERITWHAVIPDADRLLSAFDVIVLSSRTEGTPMVLLEAIAEGVPVVATRVGGVPDLIHDDEAALVASEDPGALADALLNVQRHPQAALQRAHAARERVGREHRVEPWMERYDTVYQAALDAAHSRS